MMRCNSKNTFATLTGVAILAMPIAAHAQALGARVGGISVAGAGTPGGVANVSVGGITGLGSTLGGVGATVGGSSLTALTVPSITTTGPVAINTPGVGATVLGGSSLASLTVSPPTTTAPVTIGTPGVGATLLGGSSAASVSVGGVVPGTSVAVINVNPINNPRMNVNLGGGSGGGGNLVPVSLGADGFFSSGESHSNVLFRMNGGGGGGAGGGASATAESGGSENSAQICERVLRRPGAFQRNVVQQCRRVVAQLTRRR